MCQFANVCVVILSTILCSVADDSFADMGVMRSDLTRVLARIRKWGGGGGGGGEATFMYLLHSLCRHYYVMLKVWGRTRRIIGGGVLTSTLTCTQPVKVSLTCLVPLVPLVWWTQVVLHMQIEARQLNMEVKQQSMEEVCISNVWNVTTHVLAPVSFTEEYLYSNV